MVLQTVLMNWAMEEKKHELIIPNSNTIFNWEADLLTFTRSNFIHEFEIKLNIYDFRADAKKNWKHQLLATPGRHIPNYFWYATSEFEIEPPKYAGWIKIFNKAGYWNIRVLKEAPRLHSNKATDRQIRAASRIISHHLRREYWNHLIKMEQVQ
jgi:hypothetical protein